MPDKLLPQQVNISDQPGIRYEKIAVAFRAYRAYVCPEQVRPALERALSSRKPTCISVKTDPYEKHMSEL